ncbi:MAG: NAD(P)H-binding protein [Pseudomonadota bacterium]
MPEKILLVGATGLTGGLLARQLVDQGQGPALHLLLRRPAGQDYGDAQIHIADPATWPEEISTAKPDIVISCLGSTMKKAGSKAAFAAIDRDLVGAIAEASKKAGARQMIAVSSTMADSSASSFYLRVKGEAEDLMRAQKFERLDIVRPGLLRGERTGDARLGEGLAILASPVMDRLLHGSLRRYRSIAAREVATAIRTLMTKRDAGTFIHENDQIWNLAAI